MPGTLLSLPQDRELLAYIFARFIDGELTGILEGKAMAYAPTLDEVQFLARQIQDELRHAQMYRSLHNYVKPGAPVPPAPWLLRQIMAPVSGRLWAEHCFLDKAVGERWVLALMLTLQENTDDPRIKRTLAAIASDEKTHIAFGEEQTNLYTTQSRWRRFYLWGLYLRVDYAMALAYKILRRRISRHYTQAAASLLTDFFTSARAQLAGEVAALLAVPVRRSFVQMLLCQALFLLKFIFSGHLRKPPES